LPNYYFIVNPAAGRGRCFHLGKQLEERLPQLGLDFLLEYTCAPWDAAKLAQKAVNKFDVLVVVGGDGTLHEVVNGLAGQKATLGLLPEGSGNDFALAMNIPSDLEQALQILLRDRRRSIDLGKANARYFHNGLGIGFDAWVVNQALKVSKLRGNAIYLYSVLRTLFSYRPALLNMFYDGQVHTKDFFMLTIANGISLGGGFRLTPEAQMDDKRFDVCIIENMPKLSILKNLIKVYNGKHKNDPRVQIIQTPRVQIESEQGFAIHADGELLSLNEKKLTAEIVPHAIEVIY